jgi:hypothetical protein
MQHMYERVNMYLTTNFLLQKEASNELPYAELNRYIPPHLAP